MLTSSNPADGSIVGKVEISTPEQIAGAVASAKETFQSWSALSLAKRLDYIERFRKLVLSRKSELAELITRESGKPLIESMGGDIFGVLETCRWLTRNAPRVLAPERTRMNRLFFPFKKAFNVFEPLGVIAVISPWNFPFAIPLGAILSALACGNTVVLKPSPKTPVIGERIGELFAEAGFPAGCVTVVQGDKLESELLVRSDVARVVFTGSVGGGKAIMRLASEKVHPVTLELAGKHAAIVLADSDLDKVAPAIAWGAFTNAGQACASIERVYAQRSIAAPLAAKIADATRSLRLGNGLDPETDVGPMIDRESVERVKAQVDEAVSAAAVLLAGGKERPDLGPCFYEPTVLANVRSDMDVIGKETFGPVLPIVAFDSIDEAVRLTNDSPYGLGASIWSSDLQEAKMLARRIQTGMVWINDGLYSHSCPDAPWGGIKESGFGRRGSDAGLLDFVYIKHVSFEKQGRRDWHYPYSSRRLDLIANGVEFSHRSGLLPRVGALIQLIPTWLATRSGFLAHEKPEKEIQVRSEGTDKKER